MAKVAKKIYKLTKTKLTIGFDCFCIATRIPHLEDYFAKIHIALKKGETFWFRGNADLAWRLRPSALRYRREEERNTALSLISDFKRFGEIKIPKAPAPSEEFKWVQLAQHYGLPTRLLDWTKNAAIALYFACYDEDKLEEDGAVIMLNPKDLNREAFGEARILDPNQDIDLIRKYLKLKGDKNPKGPKTVAVDPVWNSERIMLQQGVFTLHGSRYFTLTDYQASSLVYIRIRKEYKETLLEELERVGVNEMSIFPEAEHMSNYLKWREKLSLER